MPVSDDVTLFLRAKDQASKEITNVLINADALQSTFDTLRKSGESIGFDPFQNADFAKPLAGIESVVKAFDKLNIATKAGADNLWLFKANAAAAAVVMGYQIARGITGADTAQAEYNQRLEESIELNDKLIALQKSRFDVAVKGIQESKPADQRKQLEALAAQLRTELEGKQQQIANLSHQAQQEMHKVLTESDAALLKMVGLGEDFTIGRNLFGMSDGFTALNEQLAQAESQATATAEQIHQLEIMTLRADEAAKRATAQGIVEFEEKRRGSIRQITEELIIQEQQFGRSQRELLEMQLATLRADEQEREFILTMHDGKEAREAIAKAEADAASAQQLAVDRGNQLLDSLRSQAIALQIGSDGAQLYAAKIDGVSDAVLRQASAMQEQIAAMKESNKEQDRAKQLIASLQTPTEELAEKFKELFDLKAAGALDAEQFEALRAKLAEQVADEANKGKGKQQISELAATESRFLTRGRGDTLQDTSKQVADNTKKMMEELAKMVGKLNRLDEIAKKEPVKIERVS